MGLVQWIDDGMNYLCCEQNEPLLMKYVYSNSDPFSNPMSNINENKRRVNKLRSLIDPFCMRERFAKGSWVCGFPTFPYKPVDAYLKRLASITTMTIRRRGRDTVTSTQHTLLTTFLRGGVLFRLCWLRNDNSKKRCPFRSRNNFERNFIFNLVIK